MTNVKWKLGIIAGIISAVFALYPQMKLIYMRGGEWQGNYAFNDIDEVAYASYLRALIDGRPRKNDPYTGRDESKETPQPESLFSIQFAAPYLVAIPARVLGIGAPWAMTIAGAFAGFALAFAVFWLAARITDDSWFAMMSGIMVVSGGALAAGEGAIGEIFGTGFSYPYFPGLRRYIPAIAIPVFFVLCLALWNLVNSSENKTRFIFGSIGVAGFGFMVFSYFYIWTTAAAWLGCLGLLWIAVRPEGFARDFRAFSAIGAGCVSLLLPYAYLLSKRAESMDNVQLLVKTHAPDFSRFPLYIAIFVLVILIAGILIKTITIKERAPLFAASFALTVIVVFNQQVVTGHALQPIHYQVFIGNYVAALALVLSLGLVLRPLMLKRELLARVVISIFSLLFVIWGFVECHYTVRVLDDANIIRDKGIPVAKRLEELGADLGNKQTVLSFSMTQADDLPTIAPQNVLWARHQHVFAGLSWEESKERYYQYLYYSNVDENSLAERLKDGDYVSMIALFGWGRHSSRLSSEATPLKYHEIDEEALKYGNYRRNFGLKEASNPVISFVVVPQKWNGDLSIVDQWYDRDNGESLGDYVLYKVKLKEQ